MYLRRICLLWLVNGELYFEIIFVTEAVQMLYILSSGLPLRPNNFGRNRRKWLAATVDLPVPLLHALRLFFRWHDSYIRFLFASVTFFHPFTFILWSLYILKCFFGSLMFFIYFLSTEYSIIFLFQPIQQFLLKQASLILSNSEMIDMFRFISVRAKLVYISICPLLFDLILFFKALLRYNWHTINLRGEDWRGRVALDLQSRWNKPPILIPGDQKAQPGRDPCVEAPALPARTSHHTGHRGRHHGS